MCCVTSNTQRELSRPEFSTVYDLHLASQSIPIPSIPSNPSLPACTPLIIIIGHKLLP